MYPSKGGGAYAQQSYSGQQAYSQISGAGDAGAQHSISSRQEAELRAQYGGAYAAVYGSAALSSAHQGGGVGSKGATSSALQSRYASAVSESSKYSATALGEPYSSVKTSDYPSVDRRHYGDQATYLGRDIQNEPARRYAESTSIGQQHQVDMHDHMDQASLLRQQQMLKAQTLHSGSDMRQAEYLAARAASIHHGSQEYGSYGGRMDVDPRSLPILSTPYGSAHTPSILGGVPRRNVDDLYTQGSSSAVYGVGLPPGRDYVAGKGLHGQLLESDYQTLSRGHAGLGVSIDERKDDRSAYRRELERDEERRRELIREKEKEREREERERQRERERERERRDRERERDRKRSIDARRERTPPRSTRDRRGSSLLKDERTRRVSPRRPSPRRPSPRRVSPHREGAHRHRSPVKEKKREYLCKVFPFSLVEVQRDYLSLNKRYPRLFISPECSKVVLHWPKQSLHLSLHTPASFEHEYVELDSKGEDKALVSPGEQPRTRSGNTIWNAKVILMSGIHGDALKEMCSYKSSEEKIIHFNNILRFAVLKKDHSFMAIGGPWNAEIDGGDPLVDESFLVRTARRYLKDTTQLDLQNCQHWNRFLEIHYDRVGEDGLFSHKEITVLFVPDLSECLPSLEAWRTQWLAHKKEVAEREQRLAARDKRSSEKKEPVQEKVKADGSNSKGTKVTKTSSNVPAPEKEESDAAKAEKTQEAIKDSTKKGTVDQKGKEQLPFDKSTGDDVEGAGPEGKVDGNKAADGSDAEIRAEKPKPVKKKVIKKVVKGKVAGKNAAEVAVDSVAAKLDDKVDVRGDGDAQNTQENAVREEDSADPVNAKKTTRRKIIRKVPAGKSSQKVDNTLESTVNQPVVKTETDTDKKPEIKTENQEGNTTKKEPEDTAASQEGAVKATGTGKKKIIRRVIKRKVPGTKGKSANVMEEAGSEVDSKASQIQSVGVEMEDQTGKKDEGKVEINNSKDNATSEKKEKSEKDGKNESKSTEKNSKSEKGVSKSIAEVAKDKDSKKNGHGSKKERSKDEMDIKSKDANHDPKHKSSKETKDKGKPEELPRFPGLFLQTKRSKGSKVRSMSLSLDGLLDYNDKDIEESTFELSVFAESLHEYLQYQMGCCLLSFLEKLRRRYVIKKNQRKRQRDEKSEKEKENSVKRPKVDDDSTVNEKPVKNEGMDQSGEETMGDRSVANQDEPKAENILDNDKEDAEEEHASDDDNETENPVEEEEEEEEEEEDPEEIIEDDEEMKDVAPSEDGVKELNENAAITETVRAQATTEEDNGKKTAQSNNSEPVNEKSVGEKQNGDKPADSVKEVVVDKEALKAFRYFDHNRVGYIKVEDLRCLLHNLGMFLSYRDVKELVQSALFESNTARDNRIFYKKLVKLPDL